MAGQGMNSIGIRSSRVREGRRIAPPSASSNMRLITKHTMNLKGFERSVFLAATEVTFEAFPFE
jgi:hypothetical protein